MSRRSLPLELLRALRALKTRKAVSGLPLSDEALQTMAKPRQRFMLHPRVQSSMAQQLIP